MLVTNSGSLVMGMVDKGLVVVLVIGDITLERGSGPHCSRYGYRFMTQYSLHCVPCVTDQFYESINYDRQNIG